MGTSDDVNALPVLFVFQDAGVVLGCENEQQVFALTLWPEELHDSNLPIHAHLLDGPQPLCCDHIDLQPCVFSYEQIEVIRRGEVTYRQNNI